MSIFSQILVCCFKYKGTTVGVFTWDRGLFHVSELFCEYLTLVRSIEDVIIQILKFDCSLPFFVFHMVFPLLKHFNLRCAAVKGEDGVLVEKPDEREVLQVCLWDTAGNNEVLVFLHLKIYQKTYLKLDTKQSIQ